MMSSTVWHGHSTRPSLPAGTARKASGHLSERGSSILLTQDRSVAQKPHWGFCCCANASLPWQAEQAHHTPSKEKQSVPDGERPVVHIAVVCGFWQGASAGTHPVFCFALNLLTHGSRPHSSNIPPGHHRKQIIRTHLLSETSSDYFCLVRVARIELTAS